MDSAREDPFQVPLAEHDGVLQALTADRVDKSSSMRILSLRPRSGIDQHGDPEGDEETGCISDAGLGAEGSVLFKGRVPR